LDDAEIGRAPIGANNEVLTQVIDVVLKVRFPRQYRPEIQLRVRRVRVPHLGLLGAAKIDEDEFFRPALAYIHVVAVILLFVDERVRRTCTQ
jgi:hypothetical protein